MSKKIEEALEFLALYYLGEYLNMADEMYMVDEIDYEYIKIKGNSVEQLLLRTYIVMMGFSGLKNRVQYKPIVSEEEFYGDVDLIYALAEKYNVSLRV